MAKNKLRWGVISTANIGRWAVNPAIQASNNGELLAVASRHADTARDFATKWDIPRHFGNYADLLDDPEIDAVYIPLPNSLHCEWAIRAAHAGKHILRRWKSLLGSPAIPNDCRVEILRKSAAVIIKFSQGELGFTAAAKSSGQPVPLSGQARR